MAASAEEARSALDLLPRFLPLSNVSFDVEAAYVGRTYWLAGRTAEGLPLLREAAHDCNALLMPIEHTRAQLWFGQALEETGDKAGACEAYGTVLARWKDARPRSVTADRAKERVKALGCAP
jgi:eukaryotic-like serine/threonine-protein kinase